jgi:hypothetical protein
MMNAQEDLSGTQEIGPKSVPNNSKKYPFEVSSTLWLFLFMTHIYLLHEAAESFFFAGRLWPFIFILVFFLILLHSYLSMRQRRRRAIFLDSYVFPPTIMNEVAKRYPHLSDNELELVGQGLRQYFQSCNAAALKTVSMPSRVVDLAWHEFILMTRPYAQFCDNGLGRFLHHTSATDIGSSEAVKQGLKAAWFHACEWEGIDQASPSRLPLLFTIDAELNIPDGFKHSLNNDYATEMECAGGGCAGGCGGGG